MEWWKKSGSESVVVWSQAHYQSLLMSHVNIVKQAWLSLWMVIGEWGLSNQMIGLNIDYNWICKGARNVSVMKF